MDFERAVDMLAGVRVFVTSREKIKHPEGTDLFDEAIRVLREELNHRHSGGDGEAWRGIESAPRDGTVVLISDGTYREFGYSERDKWMIINNGDYTDGGYGRDYETRQPVNIYGHSYGIPTHWRPLPAPPTEDAARAGERG